MQDVATEAGVSKATVSRVLSGTVHVEEPTADLVWKAVSSLGYQIDHVAKSLATGATHTVAVLVSDLGNPFYPDFIKGVESAAHSAGLSVIVCGGAAEVSDHASVMERQLQMLVSKRVDGLIVYGMLLSAAQVRRLLGSQVKVVVVGKPKRTPRGVRAVDIDFREGMQQVVAHLNSLGHRHIASIQLRGYDEWVARSRHRAFQEALAEHGLPYRKKWVGWVDQVDDRAFGREAMGRLLKRGDEFTAVVCHNDMMAIGAMQAAHDLGVRVPEDLSVVGIDDIFASSAMRPRLTTLALPRLEIGEIALNCLLDEGRGGKRAVVQAQLVARESTGPARRRR